MKVHIITLAPRPPQDYVNARNPETMSKHRISTRKTIDLGPVPEERLEDMVRTWIEKNLPDYSGRVIVQEALRGPGRGLEKRMNPAFSKGPMKKMIIEV
jgi:hypothetical protein